MAVEEVVPCELDLGSLGYMVEQLGVKRGVLWLCKLVHVGDVAAEVLLSGRHVEGGEDGRVVERSQCSSH
jgi:hypothetical protein